jgi:hypothetical protein
MHTTDHTHNTTNHAGVPPAPSEAHQSAVGKSDRLVDDELEQCVSALERTWQDERQRQAH